MITINLALFITLIVFAGIGALVVLVALLGMVAVFINSSRNEREEHER